MFFPSDTSRPQDILFITQVAVLLDHKMRQWPLDLKQGKSPYVHTLLHSIYLYVHTII